MAESIIGCGSHRQNLRYIRHQAASAMAGATVRIARAELGRVGCHCAASIRRMLMVMFMVAEMIRRHIGSMRAIGTHRRPTQLQRQ